jgi:hypothetical protein
VAQNLGPDKALSSLADFTRWLTGLGTAGLAFAVGLQQNLGDYDRIPRWLLVAAWAMFAFSALAGIFLQSSFPVLYREEKYSIDNPWLVRTYRAALWSLIAGSVVLFICFLIRVLTDTPSDALKVRTGAEAVKIATCAVNCDKCIRGIGKVALIKGADESDLGDRTWQVRLFTGAPPKRRDAETIDVVVSAVDGKYAVVASEAPAGRATLSESPKCE